VPRDEDPVEGNGPVPQLACELSRVRERAGKPSYRKMAKEARDSHGVEVSHTVLATAASGNMRQSPSWRVVKVFLDVCDVSGDAADKIARCPRFPAVGREVMKEHEPGT
jgi:hypothetical protein